LQNTEREEKTMSNSTKSIHVLFSSLLLCLPGCGDDQAGTTDEDTSAASDTDASTDTDTDTDTSTGTDTSTDTDAKTDDGTCSEPPPNMTCGGCSCFDGLWTCDPCADPPEIGDECDMGLPCNSDAYCDYPDDLCGDGESGTCVALPQSCEGGDSPTSKCGCSGDLEVDACSLALKMTDVSLLQNCVSEELRACGDVYCTADYPCITFVPEEGESTQTCGDEFFTTCELDCECLLKEHPECTECAVEDDRLVVSCGA